MVGSRVTMTANKSSKAGARVGGGKATHNIPDRSVTSASNNVGLVVNDSARKRNSFFFLYFELCFLDDAGLLCAVYTKQEIIVMLYTFSIIEDLALDFFFSVG